MRMRAAWSLTLLLALSGAAGLHAHEPANVEAKKGSGGRLVVEKEVVDLGAVVRGQVVTATFVLKNTGTEELKILSAKPG